MSKKLENLLKLKQQQNAPQAVLEQAFPAQLRFIQDPAKRKAAFVLRRGGKTTAIAIYMVWTCLSAPASKTLYFGKTSDSSENATWLKIFYPLLSKLNIPYRKTKNLITFRNKSTIRLAGADATGEEVTKYLGTAYKLAVFDECQDLKHDLKYWIDELLGPAMIDEAGTICCIGTAGRALGRYWHDITRPDSTLDWSVHSWTAEDNPHMAEKIKAEIERLKKANPNLEQDPGFRNQFRCEWVLDNVDRVYHNTERNILTDDQTKESLLKAETRWSYLLGFDFGYEDDTAIVVGAFSKHDPHFYIVETFKKPQMLTEEIAVKLKDLRDRYQPIYMVGDCQNKTLVQTLRQQYRLPLRAADKLGKEAHIAMMNSDFLMGKIKVIEDRNKGLLDEWSALVWDEKKRVQGVFKEQASKANHAADACLYLHHFSKHFAATPEPEPDPNPMMTHAEQQLKRQLNKQDHMFSDDEYTIYHAYERTLQ